MGNLGNKEIMSRNIQFYMEKYGKSRQDMCEALGVKYTTFTDWVKGNSYPRIDKIELMANYFGISKSDLVEEMDLSNADSSRISVSNIFKISLKKFPLLGEIACGKPIYANEDRESYVMAGTNINADFCLKAKGDSMINARIHDGDIVFIRQQDTVENGEIAAVVVNSDNEATLKRFFFYQEKALLILKSENPVYGDLIFQGNELDQVHILGKAIAFQSDVK